jgi:23S rRNA pseudouridine2605 synthase
MPKSSSRKSCRRLAGSWRKAEKLIVEGRVTVNGKTITELGSRSESDHVKVDGNCCARPSGTYIASTNRRSV